MSLLQEAIKDARAEGEKTGKLVAAILGAATETPLVTRTSRGHPMEVPALWFEVKAFDGGPIMLALHHTLGEDVGGTWAITEPRTGLSCAQSKFGVYEALQAALGKIALSISAYGRTGFDKRVAGQIREESSTGGDSSSECHQRGGGQETEVNKQGDA